MENKWHIKWGISYAVFTPKDPKCGFILNPNADKIYELSFCNEKAAYGFRFRDTDPQDLGTALGAWQGACAEHAQIIREQDRVSTIWILKTESTGA